MVYTTRNLNRNQTKGAISTRQHFQIADIRISDNGFKRNHVFLFIYLFTHSFLYPFSKTLFRLSAWKCLTLHKTIILFYTEQIYSKMGSFFKVKLKFLSTFDSTYRSWSLLDCPLQRWFLCLLSVLPACTYAFLCNVHLFVYVWYSSSCTVCMEKETLISVRHADVVKTQTHTVWRVFHVLDGLPRIKPSQAAFGCRSAQSGAL